ncbi:hypothetical protein CAPTEDRAFT_198758 [Capitella teleta]|uniref:Uncharacterized protein n=1 Tax=Capitella teleta TaxID=283909 RepID=R7V0M2_CAPTE|nr:hypothetical protein CAPTEDRAFT_198758 [Capitella teleta]|eukprot:ELU09226.1 hypothetical protein CAPTEDRAFT_198758 [Capitella teleta]
MEEDAYPGAEDASDVDEDLSMSAYDAKLLGSLLTGEISTSSLSDDEIERLSKIVDGVLVGIGEEEIEDLQPRVDIPNDINSIEENEDKLAAETEPQYIYDLPEESKRKLQRVCLTIPVIYTFKSTGIAGQVSELTPGEAADHHDHGLARAQAIPTNKPQYAVVDARFVDLQVQPK